MTFHSSTGCVYRNQWKRMCSSGCSSAYNKPANAYITYAYCNFGYWLHGGGHFFEWYAIYRSYKCYDNHNNLVATPEVNGVSYAPAKDINTAVSVTLKYRYRAVVGSGDECRIYYCRAMWGTNPADPMNPYHDKYYDCPQTVGAGQTAYTQHTVSLKPNSPSAAHYWYWLDIGSWSLLARSAAKQLVHTLQKTSGTATNGVPEENFACRRIPRKSPFCCLEQTRLSGRPPQGRPQTSRLLGDLLAHFGSM